MKKVIKPLLFGFIFFISNNLTGSIPPTSDSNQTISKKGLHNISVFNKIYGYTRHFSPTLAVDTFYGWEELILKYLPRVEKASNDIELCNIINECLHPLDPRIIIQPHGKEDQLESRPQPCSDFYIYRNNHGWGNRGENAVNRTFLYTSAIQRTTNYYDFKTVYQNIMVSIPLVDCVNDSVLYQYNINKGFDPNSRKGKYSAIDKYVRMGIIMELWNVNEYFYPYMHTMKINSDAIFEKYIKIVSNESNDSIFFETLERFAAEYKDGHASFMPFAPMLNWPDYVPPIKLQKIDNKIIVTYVTDSLKYLIDVGDVIVKINNITAEQYFKNKQSRVSSATETWNRYVSEKELLMGRENTIVKLELLKGKKKKIIYLRRNIKVNTNENNANIRPNYYEIKEGYYYVNLFGLNDSSLNYAFTNYLPQAKGIVFDVRGYPQSRRVKELLSHLTSDTLYSSNWSIPIQRFPGQKKMYYRDSTFRWVLPALSPKYTDNVVFVTDGRTISGAESFMSIVEHYKLGGIVGERTAGTNGNINSFQVFGLYQFWHTEMYISTYTGKAFHGVGIIPQIKVKPRSRKDIIEGMDICIQKAIKILR